MESTDSGVRLWRTAWWPDRATVGLVIAGFFGVGLIGYAITLAGQQITEAVTGTFSLASPIPGARPLPPLPSATRVFYAAEFLENVCLGFAAVGGVLLVLRRGDLGVRLAVAGIALGIAAQVVALVAIVSGFRPGAPNFGTYGSSILSMLWHVALIVLVVGGLPLPRVTASEPAGPVSVP